MSGLLGIGLLAASIAFAGKDPEVQRDAPHDVMPERLWDFTHLHLNLRVNPEERTVTGTATHTVEPLAVHHRKIRLYQTHLDIEKVWVDDKSVDDFRILDGLIDIPVSPGQPHTVRVQYTAHPESGLHFRTPKGSADAIVEVWSQGEGQDNRHWFPGWDYPNDRFTYSAEFTAPESLHVVSNGAFKSAEAREKGWKTWTYAFDHQLVNYLVMLAVGEYDVHKEEGAVPLEYVVAKGISRDVALRSFGGAKPQLEYFNQLLGSSYPYSIYRQIAVQRFMYGGMENTTATIMSDDLLRKLPTDDSLRSESVTAHELAHQWFGDWLTCYGWRELWLNEGFASYYAMRWMETLHGEEYYAVVLRRSLQAASRGAQPMAPISHTRSGTSDNAAVYTQGLSVLHGLSVLLGRDVLDKGIAQYVTEYKDSLVESTDLRRVLEEVSGQHLGWFFDQWVTGKGTPKFKTTMQYTEPKGEQPGALTFTIEQTTKASAFHAPVEVEIGTSSSILTRQVWLHEGKTKLVIDLPEEPLWAVADPRGGLIAKWDRTAGANNWLQALKGTKTPYVRILAMTQFNKEKTSAEVVKELSKTLVDTNINAGMREFAARALGRIANENAQNGLLGGVADKNHRVRANSFTALGRTSSTPTLLKTMRKAISKDSHPSVQSAALAAFDELDKESSLQKSRVFLGQSLSPKREDVAKTAIQILGSRGNKDDVPRLISLTSPRTLKPIRQGAMWALSRLLGELEDDEAKNHRGPISRAIEPALSDPDIRMRQTTIEVLSYVGDEEAAKRLVAFASTTKVESSRESASDAANRIRNRQPQKTEEERRVDLERLEEKIKALEKSLKDVEKWR